MKRFLEVNLEHNTVSYKEIESPMQSKALIIYDVKEGYFIKGRPEDIIKEATLRYINAYN